MIGGFIGKAIGEAFSENKVLPLVNANLNFSGQPTGLTPQPVSSARTPLLREISGRDTYWKGVK